jgi:hypothetical protein
MKLSHLLAAGAVVTLVFGLALVLVPGPLLGLYGVTVNEAGILIARLFGAAFLGYTVLNWFARDSADTPTLRGIVLANLIMDVVGFVVTLLGQLAQVANALGWSSVALYLLFALGFAYFQFVKR